MSWYVQTFKRDCRWGFSTLNSANTLQPRPKICGRSLTHSPLLMTLHELKKNRTRIFIQEKFGWQAMGPNPNKGVIFDQIDKGRVEPKVSIMQLTTTKSQIEILILHKDVLRPPPQLRAPLNKRDRSKWCDFYIDHGHTLRCANIWYNKSRNVSRMEFWDNMLPLVLDQQWSHKSIRISIKGKC